MWTPMASTFSMKQTVIIWFLGVANDFEFEFFPAEDGFFNENLGDEAGGESAFDDGAEFLHVVDESAAGAAHGVGWPDDAGQAYSFDDLLGFFQCVGDFASGHLDAQAIHGLLKRFAILAALDGIDLDADDLNAMFVQYAGSIEF